MLQPLWSLFLATHLFRIEPCRLLATLLATLAGEGSFSIIVILNL